MNSTSILEENPLFSELTKGEIQQLIDLSICRSYPADQWITHYGSDWPYLFLVEQGQLIALKESPEGRSLVVMVLEKEDVFWGVGFFKEGMGMPVALVADQPARLRLWSREQLVPFLRKHGQLTWSLSQLMVERMLRASQILGEIAFQPVAGRLAHLLLTQFEEQTGETLTRELTLDEMAARIGTTREMVCRQLYKLADEGMIQINRTELKITDLKMLKETAQLLKGGER